ncbi:MAG: metal ABC transporter permease [Neomegalonema sp.]|nr:metal ABC transporter permease [Neomegalonema sp.]
MDPGLFLSALTLQAGWNAAIVALGAAALGAGGGVVGVFTLLRKRALMSDAISHATLPGVALAFILHAVLGGEGRSLPVMLIGAAASAALGVLAVQWIARRTRLYEDAAIGTVLSTFFALGVVLLSVIQQMDASGQAGVASILIGSTAGLLFNDALLIAIGALVISAAALLLAKEFIASAFDSEFAQVSGLPVARLDLLLLVLVTAVVVVGLQTVGLVLIIALTIIPPAAARLWTDRALAMVPIAAAIGGIGAYTGAALSASGPNLPTGSLVVLCLFALFVLSVLFAPARGVIASLRRQWVFQTRVHERQGLLALARREPIFDWRTRSLLQRRGFLRADGSATRAGIVAAAQMTQDQALWNRFRDLYPDEAFSLPDWSLRPIGDVLPEDMVRRLRRDLTGVAASGGGATLPGARS